MPARKLNLTGQTFGLLKVLGPAEKLGKDYRWHCQCACGNTKVVSTSRLRAGRVRSCGCQRGGLTHGERSAGKGEISPTYRAWVRLNPRPSIWDDYEVFLADIGEKPAPHYNLSRLDNRLPHGPENTRWLDRTAQRERLTELEQPIIVDLFKS